MNTAAKHLAMGIAIGSFAVVALCLAAGASAEEGLLRNPSFEEKLDAGGLPPGWEGTAGKLSVIERRQGTRVGKALRIAGGGGIRQLVPVSPGFEYRLTLSARTRQFEQGLEMRSQARAEIEFVPSGKKFRVALVSPFGNSREYVEHCLGCSPPPGSSTLRVSVTSGGDEMTVDDLSLVRYKPSPSDFTLKEMHLRNALVADGKPCIKMVLPSSGRYDRLGRQIVEAIRTRTGAVIPVVPDTALDLCRDQGLEDNLILLGNRSTNRAISDLYDLYYCILDLRYPGRGGSVVRSLHDPFGEGHNVILVGASDDDGMEKAVGRLLAAIGAAEKAPSGLQLGYLADIRLGSDVHIPPSMTFDQLQKIKPWDATHGTGGYGWTVLTKCLAYYYLTGSEFYAREFLRLAFPKDPETIRQLESCGQDFRADRKQPLVDVYHYRAHLPVVYWDLVEESPVFSDDDRSAITRQLMKLIEKFCDDKDYGCEVNKTVYPLATLGSRHHHWAAMTFWTTGRYLGKYYPDYQWRQVRRAAENFFAALYTQPRIRNAGEGSRIVRYPTTLAGPFDFTLMSGNKHPARLGSLQDQTHLMEVLLDWQPDAWVLDQAPTNLFNQMAYLLGDLRYARMRELTQVQGDVFRPGQSYWPDERWLPSQPPPVCRWEKATPVPQELSFWSELWGEKLSEPERICRFASFRTACDAKGDFLLLDAVHLGGVYHCFALYELVLGGHLLLLGDQTHFGFMSGGMTAPKLPRYAKLRRLDSLGQTAFASADVPNYNFADWNRTILHRQGRYTLVVDRLNSLQDAGTCVADCTWQLSDQAALVHAAPGLATLAVSTAPCKRPGAAPAQAASPAPGRARFSLGFADKVPTESREIGKAIGSAGSGKLVSHAWTGSLRKGEQKRFFTLIGPSIGASPALPGNCLRIGPSAAAIMLAEGPGLVVAGSGPGVTAEVAVLGPDQVAGCDVTRAGEFLASDQPVDVDWDFSAGTLALNCPHKSLLTVASDQLLGDSASEAGRRVASGKWQIGVAPGRHHFKAKPTAAAMAAHQKECRSLWMKVVADRASAAVIELPDVHVSAVQLSPDWRSPLQGFPYALEVFRHQGQPRLAVSEGRAVAVFDPAGKMLHRTSTDAIAKVLHYWPPLGLLAAGCQDFKVIAFDPATAARRWVFESKEINPVFKKGGTTGWFDRSPPWNKGIFALNSGSFLGGKSQLLVGTASTVEALDEHGILVKSMLPGCGVVCDMTLLDRGTDVVLMPALPHGRAMIHQLSNRDPDHPTVYSVGAFAPRRNAATFVSEYKNGYVRLVAEDLNADGRQELVGLFNGSLNGLHVWNAQGEVLGDAAFGDGQPTPFPTHDPVVEQRNVRDLAIADLDGDGKKEIAVITSRGFLLVFDCQCHRLWGHRLPSEPIALAGVPAGVAARGRLAVGCRGGQLLVLDARGDFVAQATIEAVPVRMSVVDGLRLLVATSKAELLAYRLQ